MTNITEDIKYIGVNDREIDLFEGQYEVPNGMAYNSYVILDEKVAVMDTVDRHFTAEWLKNLESALAGRQPDYLIVQHMEPDHSAHRGIFRSLSRRRDSRQRQDFHDDKKFLRRGFHQKFAFRQKRRHSLARRA